MRTLILSACALLLIRTLSIGQANEQSSAADSLLRGGQLSDAIPLYHSILDQEPDNRGAAYNLYELDARGRLSGVTSRVWSATRRDFVDVPLSGLRDA